MDIDKLKRVGIIGWGRTGFYLSKLLLSLKKEVKVSELRERQEFPSNLINKFKERGVEFEFGGHQDSFFKDCDLVILSPGVNTSSSAVKACQELNIPWVGEIEFCSWLTSAKFIGITGTNGKTTTSFLTYRVLRRYFSSQIKVFLGGNIGIPLSSFILNTGKGDLIVLELSSFQLESIARFRPFIAALLNIEPDHLDRYTEFKDYFEAKMKIFKNQQSQDWSVLKKNSAITLTIEKRIKSKIAYFSNEFSNDNFSCVYRIVNILGVDKTFCKKIFSSFPGLPHRLQIVRRLEGVNFINDSKATNPSSTVWAIKNIRGPIVLIAGGRDKNLDYTPLLAYLKKIKKINLIGEAAFRIQEIVGRRLPCDIFSSLEEAVFASFKEAKPEGTVLFSPMCSSFDMFSNYQERGKKFIEIVNKI